mmetsp:Transcript_58947/g.128157  ORF Transcript_58947/g.128157 Transcript_58947/m.128157 type:complete len:243 (-) Transcript_58947:541-1269(-)
MYSEHITCPPPFSPCPCRRQCCQVPPAREDRLGRRQAASRARRSASRGSPARRSWRRQLQHPELLRYRGQVQERERASQLACPKVALWFVASTSAKRYASSHPRRLRPASPHPHRRLRVRVRVRVPARPVWDRPPPLAWTSRWLAAARPGRLLPWQLARHLLEPEPKSRLLWLAVPPAVPPASIAEEPDTAPDPTLGQSRTRKCCRHRRRLQAHQCRHPWRIEPKATGKRVPRVSAQAQAGR